MAIKHFVPMVAHSFPLPTHLISICKRILAQKTLRPQTQANIFTHLLDHVYEAPFANNYENEMPKGGQKCLYYWGGLICDNDFLPSFR